MVLNVGFDFGLLLSFCMVLVFAAVLEYAIGMSFDHREMISGVCTDTMAKQIHTFASKFNRRHIIRV